MSDAVERLLIRIDASTEQLRRELKRAEKAVSDSDTRMQKAIGSMGNAWKGADKWVQQHSNQLKLLGAAAVGSAGFAVKAIAEYSDTYKNLQGQLKLVTGSQDDLNTVWAEALEIANGTGVSLESTVTLYARMARATEELGVGQQQLLEITDTINKAFVVSGATAQESSASIIQLSQAMAKGRLDGQELNAVLEQSPRLARLIADEMDEPIGALKDLGSQGKITSEIMISAFKNGADAIDKEFLQMPVTVGRAMNEVRNQLLNAFGQADLEPLTREIQKFGEVLKDPEVIKGLTELAAKLVTLTGKALELTAAMPGMTAAVGKFFGLIDKDAGDRLIDLANKIGKAEEELQRIANRPFGESRQSYKRLQEEIAKLQAEYDNLAKSMTDTWKTTDKLEESVEAAAEQQSTFAEATADSAEATEEDTEAKEQFRKEVEQLIDSLEDLQKRHEKANEAITEGIEAIDDITRETQGYIKELEFELSLIGKSEREQAVMNAARDKGARATAAQREEIERLTGEIYDQNAAMEASKEAQQRMVDAIDGARGTLSDFFFEFAMNGENAFDSLVEGFKSMIAKMLAEAAANQILLGFGALANGIGLPGVANAAIQAGGGAQDILGTLSGGGSLVSTISSGLTGISTSLTTTLSNLGLGDLAVGFQNAGASIAPGFQGVNQVSVGAGLNLAGGLAGSYLGQQVFGDSTGLGGTAGGIAGTILGGGNPIATAVGSFLGEGLEKVAGDLFGFGSGGNNAAIASFTDGSFSSQGLGKNFSEKNLSAVTELASIVSAFAESIGGSDFDGQLKVGNKNGIKFKGEGDSEGRKFKDADAFLAFAFEEVIQGSEGLDDALKEMLVAFEGTAEETALYAQTLLTIGDATENIDEGLKDLVLGFQGSAEEMAEFTQAMLGMNAMIEQNPVSAAIDKFTADAAASSMTLTQAYSTQLTAISELVSRYDGSTQSAQALNQALAINKETAYQLAMAIQGVSDSIDAMFAESAQQIRESVMSQEERVAAWRAQREVLTAQLDDLFDPTEIQETAAEVNRLNNLIFQSLSQEQQQVQAEAFAQFAEQTNEIAQTQLSAVLESARVSQEQLNQQLRGIMTSAASQFSSAADQFTRAAQIIAAAADAFQSAPSFSEVA